MRRYLLLVLYFGVLSHLVGQEVYYVTILNPQTISRSDLSNCASLDTITLPDDIDVGLIAFDINFHPDGRMYVLNRNHLLQYDFTTQFFEIIEDGSVFYSDAGNIPGMAIDEEGHFTISGGDEKVGRNHIVDYDLRSRQVLQDQSSDEWTYHFIGRIHDYFIPVFRAAYFYPDSSGFWVFDLDGNKPMKYFDWGQDREYTFQLLGSSVLYEPCDSFRLVSSVSNPEEYKEQIGHHILYPETSVVKKVCVPIDRYMSSATHTDFRQSPLRIDLDADNSSGHRTAGYYDTLTTCHKEVPVMDDVELYTCGQKVDYISFRLRYYDTPRLPEEQIYSEDFPDQLEEPSPGRYVWQNTYGADKEKIKEYLRSLRYHADWNPDDPNESRERVVMTTMHVGNDSTTSWSVFQLETDEVYAGRDTLVEYCPKPSTGGGHLDLTYFLSDGVNKLSGRFDPELSAGRGLFEPYVDEDGDYLYIIEQGGCADTAVIRVERLETYLDNIAWDTVKICPGEQMKIGFPPGKLSSIEWWDGSTEDSIWIGADDINPYVEVSQGTLCTGRVDITVLVRIIGKAPGRDTTIRYCAGGAMIDLKEAAELSGTISYEVNPPLSTAGGSLVFDPAVDTPGMYQLVARIKGCTDTIAIVMEETMTRELVLEPVRLCAGTTQRIGLESGVYDQVTWWNGDTGDSTTVSSVDSGPFTVEAEKDGCTYQGEVDVTLVPDVVLPDDYPDQLTICAGQPRAIPVFGLDSVGWRDAIYYPGEEITINREGGFILRGYQDGCYAEKSISVDELIDPSAGYTKTIEWCPQTVLTISLPEDNTNWAFRWKDGHDSSSRTIDSIGRYPFLIESDFCTFTGYYDVIESTNCNDDCTVSIPNAISPNGDGINDHLEVFSDCSIRVIEIRIFDKWGGELYRVQGGEVEARIWEDLPPGVVMVQVTYETGQGKIVTVVQGVMVVK